MRVATPRWGEVTIKKQGTRKNIFVVTRSFSILKTEFVYDINNFKEVLELVTNLTEKLSPIDLKLALKKISDDHGK